jgi:hypothetical protein
MDGDSANAAVALAAAFVAAILTTLGSRWVAHYQAKKQEERDELAHERQIAQAKTERLRRDYANLLHAGKTMEKVAIEMLFMDGADLRRARWDGLDEALADAKAELDRSIVNLTLEPDDAGVLALYEEVEATYRDFTRQVVHEERNAERGVSEEERSPVIMDRLQKDLAGLKDAAREQLAAST